MTTTFDSTTDNSRPGTDVETKHPVCPWCWEPITEQSNRDGSFRGVLYVQRTYRCNACSLTLYANQDARQL